MFVVGALLKQKHVMEALYRHICDGYFQTGHVAQVILIVFLTLFSAILDILSCICPVGRISVDNTFCTFTAHILNG